MNNAEAKQEMLALLVKVRQNSDLELFDWTKWEQDADSLLSRLISGGIYGFGGSMGRGDVQDQTTNIGSAEVGSGGAAHEGNNREGNGFGRGDIESYNQ